MEANEITRRNVAIAKYMGLSCPPTYDGPNSTGRGYYSPDELQYHLEYSWLMPVVERICDTTKEVFHCGPSYKGGWFARFSLTKNSMGDTQILATWIAVSDHCLSLEK